MRRTLKDAVEDFRREFEIRGNRVEYYFDEIIGGDWGSSEFLDVLLIPAIKWTKENND
mgnify:CR=1 FL=1